MGAAQLARYAQELKLGNKLADGHYEALLTRAKRVIHDHMHVQDADKVALAEEYEKQMEYLIVLIDTQDIQVHITSRTILYK